MFEKVLLTTDGSRFAEDAAKIAIGLATQCGAEVRVVTVVEHPPYYGTPEASALYDAELYRSLSAELEKLGQEAVDRLAKTFQDAGLTTSSVVRRGAPADEVVAEAAEWGASVVVVSTHGRTGLSRLVLGSVANQIVNHAPCPVMLYRVKKDQD
jgi:nucleotide-binding universal stress UspA family protein